MILVNNKTLVSRGNKLFDLAFIFTHFTAANQVSPPQKNRSLANFSLYNRVTLGQCFFKCDPKISSLSVI